MTPLRKTTLPALTLITLATLLSGCATDTDQPVLSRARGMTTIQGETAIVEIIVDVGPSSTPEADARAILTRMYPEVTPLDPWRFTTTGLVWDQFFDGAPNNDFVGVNYNGDVVPSSLGGVDDRAIWWASQQAWNEVPSSNFAFADGGDTSRCPSLVQECKGPQAFDGNNDFAWVEIHDPHTLGVTWYSTSTDEFDMALDLGRNWYGGADPGQIPDNYVDAPSVLVHEFGHAVGLGHEDDVPAVMSTYYTAPLRDLQQDDVDGITSLYPLPEPCTLDSECDDGDACNGAETCSNGACAAGTPVGCDDGDACTDDTCNPGDGSCSHGATDCDDGESCTLDSCDSVEGCVHDPNPDPVCACVPNGDACTDDTDCCSNKCRGRAGAKTCK